MVLKDGEIVYEYGDTSELYYIASCRKSVLSILYGKYVESGKIDLDDTIGELGIDDKDTLLDIEKQATVRDIISSRSGVFHVPANGGYDKDNILERGSVKPGEYYVYNNWDFNVAGYILEEASGNSVYEEIENQLAIPLGFQDWNMKNQREKSSNKSLYPAYHITISTRDMAKIGQLMLNKGVWNGEQLIPESWIDEVISPKTSVEIVNDRYGKTETSDVQFSYGYMWWILEQFYGSSELKGSYTATGFGGQFITVIPKHNMVIAHKTKLSIFTELGLFGTDVGDRQYWDIVKMLIESKE